VNGLGPWSDGVHAAHPNTPIGFAEYGGGANPAAENHELPVVETGTDRTNSQQSEEYQAYLHEGYWAQIVSRPYLGLTSVWNMFDFASQYRNEGNEPGLNTKGLVTYDRSIKKDAFYFYRAQWSKTPVTYIASRRYPGFALKTSTVKVYSNQTGLTLTLNGQAFSSPTALDAGGFAPPNVYVWENVPWVSGENTVTVTAPASHCTSMATYACSDTVTWSH
jgi:beta-galactosidase